jgi:long-chain acyl-CoA synthetase
VVADVNIATMLTKAARTHPDRVALRQGESQRTYAELDARATAIAGGLGVSPGDRVVIWSENRIELVEALFAIWRAGAVAVPVNHRLREAEVAAIVEDAGASVVCTSSSAELGAPLVDITDLPVGPAQPPREAGAGELGWLFYTSGTTGRSKGACLSHENLLSMSVSCLADIHGFQPEDVVLHAAPLSHGSGLYMLPAIARGTTNVLASRGFDPPEIVELVEHEQVSVVAFVAPTMIVKLLDDPSLDPARLATLRNVVYGGGPMYVKHIRRAIELLGPIWTQLYGQGESPMTGTYLRREEHRLDTPDHERRLGSIGIPRTDIELRIDAPTGEPGEILLRGPTVMSGYWRDPEATAETLRGGWLHTGDVAFCDEQGYVFLVDRLKDMIVSGGSNVYAREVEETLLTHPLVREAAVVGLPDDYWGEIVHAFVVTGGESPTETQLIEHCAARIAPFKKPKSVEFVDDLPKNAYGKVLKRVLRERHASV